MTNHAQFKVFTPNNFGGVHTDRKKENSLLFTEDILVAGRFGVK